MMCCSLWSLIFRRPFRNKVMATHHDEGHSPFCYIILCPLRVNSSIVDTRPLALTMILSDLSLTPKGNQLCSLLSRHRLNFPEHGGMGSFEFLHIFLFFFRNIGPILKSTHDPTTIFTQSHPHPILEIQ